MIDGLAAWSDVLSGTLPDDSYFLHIFDTVPDHTSHIPI